MGWRVVVCGGGVDGLGTRLVAPSPLCGWRNEVKVHEAGKLEHNLVKAIAERSLVVGYEAAVGAAVIQ